MLLPPLEVLSIIHMRVIMCSRRSQRPWRSRRQSPVDPFTCSKQATRPVPNSRESAAHVVLASLVRNMAVVSFPGACGRIKSSAAERQPTQPKKHKGGVSRVVQREIALRKSKAAQNHQFDVEKGFWLLCLQSVSLRIGAYFTNTRQLLFEEGCKKWHLGNLHCQFV